MKEPDSLKPGSNTYCYEKAKLDTPIIAETPYIYKVAAVMSDEKSEKYIKFIRDSEETLYLREHQPNAFLLLSLIAERARRMEGHPDGLKSGEAYIGDYKKAGIETRDKYRHALKVLESRAHITILETCRNRKKAPTPTPTQSTTVGTKVRLISSTVYDINIEEVTHRNPHRNPHRTPTEPPPNPHEEECKEREECKEEEILAPTASRRRKSADILVFSFEDKKFTGISDGDLEAWRVAYPGIDLWKEIKAAEQWIISEPTRGNKKLWRKFLTGWLGRASTAGMNKSAGAHQRKESDLEKQWETANREQFFIWKKQEYEKFKNVEYRNGFIINSQNGKDISLKCNPNVFGERVAAVAGLKYRS